MLSGIVATGSQVEAGERSGICLVLVVDRLRETDRLMRRRQRRAEMMGDGERKKVAEEQVAREAFRWRRLGIAEM